MAATWQSSSMRWVDKYPILGQYQSLELVTHSLLLHHTHRIPLQLHILGKTKTLFISLYPEFYSSLHKYQSRFWMISEGITISFRIKFCYLIKMRPVTVRRPQLYSQPPPIQNLGETEVACKISAHLDLN